MTSLIPIALFGWLPLVVILFALLPPRRAVVVAFVAAWLILPRASFNLPGLPEYSKVTAASLGVILAALLLDTGRLLQFRPRWIDLPMLVVCLCPMPTSLRNGLGLYNGAATVLAETVRWGLPYFIGRVYLGDGPGRRTLAVVIFVGGLAYILPCLFEIRFSPMLHGLVYGLRGHYEGRRYGGFRPRVFIGEGLELGMWMTAASLAGVWLWAGGVLRRVGGYSVGRLLAVLLVTTVLCKATGALILLSFGTLTFWVIKRTGSRLPLVVLLAAAPLYIGLRVTGLWSGAEVIELSKKYINAERAWSLQYRMLNEDVLARRALERPIFGWGGYNRNRVVQEKGIWGNDIDGYWILTLGIYGLVGLVAGVTAQLLPLARLVLRPRPRRLLEPDHVPATMLAVLLGLWMIDNITNYMYNPIYTLAMGALAELPAARRSGSGGARRRSAGAMPSAGRRVEGEAVRSAGPEDLRHLAVCFERYGQLLRAGGRSAEAAVAIRRARAARLAVARGPGGRPEDRGGWTDALNNLAWALAHEPDPGAAAEAIGLAARAVALAPGHAAYWNTLGAATGRAGRWDEAIPILERAATLGGGTGFDFYYLALAHAHVGDRAAARLWYERGTTWAAAHAPGHAGLIRLGAEAADLVAAPAALPAPRPGG